MFSQQEIDFINSQELLRLATVDSDGQPDVTVVIFDFDGTDFHIGGGKTTRTYKHMNVVAGNTKVSLVLDEVIQDDPWDAQGVKLHGTAEVVTYNNRPHIKITPTRHWSWGIHGPVFVDGAFTVHPTRW